MSERVFDNSAASTAMGDLHELVSRMMQEADPQLRAAVPSIRPEVLLDPEVPKVMADPELLKPTLNGLVLNALDAMPEGGNLNVQTQRTESGDALLTISDNGRGWFSSNVAPQPGMKNS